MKKIIIFSIFILLGIVVNDYAATITRYINTASSGGDGTTNDESGANAAYASMSAWEAAEQQDLTDGEGDVMIANCSTGSGTAADTTAVTFDGWTLGASNTVTISGDNTTGLYSTSHYRLEVAGDVFRTARGFLIFNNMQFKVNATAHDQSCFTDFYINGNETIIFNNCIFRGSNDNTYIEKGLLSVDVVGGNVYTYTLNNCILYDFIHGTWASAAQVDTSVLSIINLNNCTIYNSHFGVTRGNVAGAVTIKNTVVFNCDDDINGTITLNYCATDDGDDSGNNGNITITQSADDWAALVTDAAGGDFSITDVNSELYNAGTDLSGSGITDDIIGTERPQATTYDIGAFEFLAGAPPAAAPSAAPQILILE